MDVISRIPGNHEKFWIISDTFTRDDRYCDIVFNKDILEGFVDRYCVVMKSALFSGSYVRLVEFSEEKYVQAKKDEEKFGEIRVE